MDQDLKRRLRADGQGLQATVHVGRGGVDEGLVAEMDAQLKRHHLVKVRIQRGAAGGDRQAEGDLAEDLVSALGAELVERRGHTVLIYRRGKPPTGTGTR
jgi:RNA-binding protein